MEHRRPRVAVNVLIIELKNRSLTKHREHVHNKDPKCSLKSEVPQGLQDGD